MRAAIYCRLSEEDRNKQSDDSESIQNQKSMLLQYVMGKGWDIFGIYSDDDYAGADRNRPEWTRLIADAQERKFDVVLCKTQSRFTRELEMVEKYIHGLFPEWGIRFIGVVDNADTEVKGNKKSRQINGLVSEWYLEDMSENIKSVLTNRRLQGFHIGAFALYGYKKDPDNKGRLIVDDEAAAVVREVFTMYANGYGRTAIARMLNDRGIPNPTEYKRLKGLRYNPPKSKAATLWKYFAISDMLTNEMYIGTMVQGKYGSVSYKSKENKPRPKEDWIRVEGTHEAIIDHDLWNKVQEMVRKNAKPFSSGKIGLFAKTVRCMYCGYTMRSIKTRGRYYLTCGTKHTAKDACIGSFIPVSELEKIVLDELRSLLDEHLDLDEVERMVKFSNNFDERVEKLRADKSVYVTKIIEYTKAIKDSYLDKAKGIISETEFLEYSRDFSNEKRRIEALAKDLDAEITALESKRENMSSKREIVEYYTTAQHLDRIMVEKLIDYITVGKRDKETRQVPIKIYWNF